MPYRCSPSVLRLPTVAAVFLAGLACVRALEPLTWVQVTDTHYPHADSGAFVSGLAGLPAFVLPNGSGPAPDPDFMLITGDLFEFSHGSGWWDEYTGRLAGLEIPVYMQAGNHDNTWRCIHPELRALYGNAWYSFAAGGVHVVALCSAGIQDPRPGFGQEQVEWLRRDLAAVERATPVIVAVHHPLGGREFAGAWDQDRVLDLLRPFRHVLFVSGHYHQARVLEYEGFEVVLGTQGYQDAAGYNLFVLNGSGRLRVFHYPHRDLTSPVELLDRDLLAPDRALPLQVGVAPVGDRLRPQSLRLQAVCPDLVLAGVAGLEAGVMVDGGEPVPAVVDDAGIVRAEVEVAGLVPGAHELRVRVLVPEHGWAEGGTTFHLAPEPGSVPLAWHTGLPTGVRGTPLVTGAAVVIAGLDGAVYWLDPGNGRVLNRTPVGGGFLAAPVLCGERVVTVTDEGRVDAWDAPGVLQWTAEVGCPVLATPAATAERVWVVDAEGRVTALDPGKGGEPVWSVPVAGYAVESDLVLDRGRLYLGAWDTFVYCVDADTGEVLWRSVGAASDGRGAARYYSPADARPVVAAGTVFVADRGMKAAAFDPVTGERGRVWDKCSALGTLEPDLPLLMRRTDGRLTVLGPDLEPVWERDEVGMGSLPVPLVAGDGVVYAVSATGRVRALSAADGDDLWTYDVTPGSWVQAAPGLGPGLVCIAALDGRIAAFARP